MKRRAMLLAVATLAACTEFESPTIVLDLRVLGVTANPPEILVPAETDDIDINMFDDVEFCALVADPGESRSLSYQMLLCPPRRDGRCPEGSPFITIGSGTVEDPEESDEPVRICETLGPNPIVVDIIEESVNADNLLGFGAIDVMVQFNVRPTGTSIRDGEYAKKAMRFGANLPAERTPNENPQVESVHVSRPATGARGLDFDLPRGRCGDIEPALIPAGERIGLLPIPADGARQDYLVPTFDGDARMITEYLTYHFFATEGDWTRGSTGGERDFVGNEPPTDTAWTAPDDPELVEDGLDVQVWIVQRDERGGQDWFLSCLRVVP